jgi:hypothetical protein
MSALACAGYLICGQHQILVTEPTKRKINPITFAPKSPSFHGRRSARQFLDQALISDTQIQALQVFFSCPHVPRLRRL